MVRYMELKVKAVIWSITTTKHSESYGKSVPKTWDEFVGTGKILAKDGISMMLSELRFIEMYQQAGGKFFNEDGEFEMDEDLSRRF